MIAELIARLRVGLSEVCLSWVNTIIEKSWNGADIIDYISSLLIPKSAREPVSLEFQTALLTEIE
jgi:hypothetical protein